MKDGESYARVNLGRPLNTLVSIHLGQVVLPGTPADKRRALQKRLRDWLWKQHRVRLTAAWSLEAKQRDVHMHMILHLPCKRNRRFPKERYVKAVRAYLMANLVPDEPRPEEMVKAADREPWNTDLYPRDPIQAALYYVSKRNRFGKRSGGDQGQIRGKRAGVTPNIDQAARAQEFANYRYAQRAAA